MRRGDINLNPKTLTGPTQFPAHMPKQIYGVAEAMELQSLCFKENATYVASFLEALVLDTLLATAKSLACFLLMTGSLHTDINSLVSLTDGRFPLDQLCKGKHTSEENKDASETEDDEDDEDGNDGDDDDDDGDDEDFSGDEGGEEADSDDDPEANGGGGSDDEDDDDDDDDNDEDDGDDDDEEEEDEEEEEEEETPQPPSKKRK
ncbi:hypothetical protein CR513_58683, partial [Mucuna pruriens]